MNFLVSCFRRRAGAGERDERGRDGEEEGAHHDGLAAPQAGGRGRQATQGGEEEPAHSRNLAFTLLS